MTEHAHNGWVVGPAGPTPDENDGPTLDLLSENYLDALERIHNTELEPLLNEYNEAVGALDTYIRTKKIDPKGLPGFKRLAPRTVVDCEKLVFMLGEDEFKTLGGSVVETKHYTMKADTLKSAMARGAVTPELYNETIKVTVPYSSPKKMELP
jgi:hypothetical protein